LLRQEGNTGPGITICMCVCVGERGRVYVYILCFHSIYINFFFFLNKLTLLNISITDGLNRLCLYRSIKDYFNLKLELVRILRNDIIFTIL